jgi:hypothetical protein
MSESKDASQSQLRLRLDRYIADTRKPGDDYCWECGHVAPHTVFVEKNRCPNPSCPNPSNWDD